MTGFKIRKAMPRNNLISFDWAMKRMLRQKSNFVVLEGFLTTLLKEKITIIRMLESEGNQEHEADKFNRVDMLAEDSKGELIIIEVQNNRELDYFHRMLYGVSKAVTDYISKGEPYSRVKKVYSINIVYFDLGQGKDYVYHGKTEFHGLHERDILGLSARQREQFTYRNAGEIFPEYYVLRVNEFDKHARTPLDEWIAFLKTGEIPNKPHAEGLKEAKEILNVNQLSEKERLRYESHMEALRYQRSVIQTGIIDGRAEGLAEGKAMGRAEGLVEGLAKGEKLKQQEIARKMKMEGISAEMITKITGLTTKELDEL